MFTTDQFKDLFSLLRQEFTTNQSALNQLDSAVGDGDHGYTIHRAMRAAESAASGSFQDLGKTFDAVAEAMAEQAGGAIGPLLAALFAEGGIVFAGKTRAGLDDFKEFLAGGLQAVKEIGGAQPGDKTLVDALEPAAAALESGSYPSLEAALQAAAEAARQGAESTREMTAARGRASFSPQRSLGHLDPGATSLAIILEAMADFLGGARASTAAQEEAGEFTPPPGKLVNHPDLMVQQDNQGLAACYPDLVRLSPQGILLRAREKKAGRTALVIGHGGGHTPSMGGFVGPGLLDGDVYGPIFTCASGVAISRAIAAADRGGGVVLLISNHAGDVLNARLALRRSRAEGTAVEPVYLGDDIATAPREMLQDRRGLGGLLFALKIGGAAAEEGKGLEEVAALMRKTNQRTATLSVAVKPPTHPATGQPLFEIPPGEIEIGTGVHGEVGVYRGPQLAADQIVDLLLDRLLEDLDEFLPGRLLLFINGSGGTSQMELHILYRRAFEQIKARGLESAAGVVGSFFTTLEMGGFSLSLCALDWEMESYWELPASSPAFRWPFI